MAVVLGLAAISSSARDPQEPKDTIKSIMKKLHVKDKGHLNQAKAALKANPIDWAAVEKAAAPIETLGKVMGELEPPRGEKEDFAKLCKAYSDHAAELIAAAKDKKKPEADKAAAALSTSCKTCHDSHK
jgi:cytochrome c556